VSRSKPDGSAWLLAGGIASLLIAALHVVIIAAGPRGYRYFGAANLVPLAERGSPIPALLTAGVAVIFGIWGAYGLSGAGVIRPLPLIRTALILIGVLFALRGLILVQDLFRIAGGSLHPVRAAVFSAASLLIGLLYLLGVKARWPHLAPRRP